MNDKAWKDESRGTLDIGSFRSEVGGPERVWISAENGLYVDDLATLDAIIGHLTGLRSLFPESQDVRRDERFDIIKTHLLLMCYLPQALGPMVAHFHVNDREYVKRVILFLGDSRNVDGEFDLSRDHRTESMLSEEERALMPSEVQDGKRVYYCTVQRRKQ